ncbi:PIG-L family deacetylase [Streptomyces kanamyceticus]|uniref:PIG-L family deacetylase n=1 Tax=Streptomyces kanamyceticus TaxID=1967 RepID=A0A5J6G8L8_STRKN|nr:PIG-L family deacetylase [Streptomyces kanamyceticus]QEU90952.1 PIG-L family deacetylase [Streptomyces kanamyceticus]
MSPPYAATRRQVLAGALGVLAGVTVAGCDLGGRPGGPKAPVHAVDPYATGPFAAAGKGLLLQVIAHPDDDLFFMNPQCHQLLSAGVPVVTVVVTAGEAGGRNRVPHQLAPVVTDKPGYSGARQQGMRQAYAEMLGLDRFTPWQRTVLALSHGARAETDELAAGDRRARLVFLNIAMRGAGGVRLPALWDTPGTVMRTVEATDSPDSLAYTYDHRTLVDVLAGLMAAFRPTVVHTMDPDPDYQAHDARHPRGNDQPRFSDHRDHTPTALFTWKALSQWVAECDRRDGHAPRFTTMAFRGYYNQRWPYNLPPAVLARKARYIAAYGGAPGWECHDYAGCGDYSQGGTHALTSRKGWARSTHPRYPGPLPVSATDRAGRTVAYGVLGTQAVRWRETVPGSARFGTPRNLGGGPLAPVLSAVVDAAARHLLFGLRFAALDGQGRADTREIVVLEQREPDGPFGPWRRLGTPDAGAERGRRVGCPVAVATPDHRVHLFARTAAQDLATRVREASGRWGPWHHLGGGQVQDGLTVVLDTTGRIHVYAAGHDAVHHWSQARPGGPVTVRPPVGGRAPAGAPAAVLEPDGHIALIYRTQAAATPYAYGPSADLAGTPLPHFTGYAPVTAQLATEPGGGKAVPVLLGLDDDGQAQLQFGTAAAARPLTAPGPEATVGTPSLLTPRGRPLSVVGMSPDTTPWIWRPQTAPQA